MMCRGSGSMRLIEEKWKSEGMVQELAQGQALLGYCTLAFSSYVLIATKVKLTLELPGNHIVYTVQQSEWKKISIQPPNPPPNPQQEEAISKLQKMIQSFPLTGTHYYCETLDITRPFPSEHFPADPCWEFVWNRWLTAPLREIELPTICPALLQGQAELKIMKDLQEKNFSIAMISRRSRLHAGTRYNARGLNKCSCPGNEVEVETIVFRNINEDNDKPEQPHRQRSEYHSKWDWDIQWSSHIHRRGTVPIWWSVQLKNSGIGEAEIKINNTKGDLGKLDTKRYFRRLQKRYAIQQQLSEFENDIPDQWSEYGSFNEEDQYYDHDQSQNESQNYKIKSHGSELERQWDLQYNNSQINVNSGKNYWANQQQGYKEVEEEDPSKKVSIINVNLLRKNAFDKQEMKLSSAYAESIQWLRTEYKLPINICNFDWHDLISQVQLPEAVNYLWLQLANEIKSQGISRGIISRYRDDVDNESQSYRQQVLKYGRELRIQFFERQQGILRFNCADSLDRTNLAAYYTTLQVVVEQCHSIGLFTSYSQPNKEYLRDCPALTLIFNENDEASQHQANIQAIKQQNQQQSALMSQLRKGMKNLFGTSKPRVRSTPGMTQTVYQPNQITDTDAPQIPHIKSEYLASNNQNDYRNEPQNKEINQSTQNEQHQNGRVSQQGIDSQLQLQGQNIDQELPEGWDKKWLPDQNRYVYIDHINKHTSWSPPEKTGSEPNLISQNKLTGAPQKLQDNKSLENDNQQTQKQSNDSQDLTSPEVNQTQEAQSNDINQNSNTQQNIQVLEIKDIEQNNQNNKIFNASKFTLDIDPLSKDNSKNHAKTSEGGSSQEDEGGLPPEQTSTLVKESYLVNENGQTSMIAQQKVPLALDKTLQQNITEPQKLEFNDKPWGLIQALLEPNQQKPKYNNVQAFALQVQPQLLSRVAELFVMNGNVNAALYTGSDAMHLDKILLFESEGSPLRLKFQAQNNAYIAIIRRYNNLWSDADKQMVIQFFLGENLQNNSFIKYNQEDVENLIEYPDSDEEEYKDLQKQYEENVEKARRLQQQQQQYQQQKQQQQLQQLNQQTPIQQSQKQYQSPNLKQFQHQQQDQVNQQQLTYQQQQSQAQ